MSFERGLRKGFVKGLLDGVVVLFRKVGLGVQRVYLLGQVHRYESAGLGVEDQTMIVKHYFVAQLLVLVAGNYLKVH
jgi:hypothetical protein